MKSLTKLLRFIRNLLVDESIGRQYWNSFLAPWSVRKFTRKHLKFSPIVSKAIKRKHPRYDRYLLKRIPALKLTLTNEGKLNFQTSDMYKPKFEHRVNQEPYIALFNTIDKVLSEIKPKSITEIGCSTGPLLEILNRLHPEIALRGIEGFEFYKDLAYASIRDKIEIADLRRPLGGMETSDLTICLEVAEHIDPLMLDVFLKNIYSSTSRWLIMSWSSTYPPSDAPPQHISPVSLKQYRKIMTSIGFVESESLTELFREESLKHEHFQAWWRKGGIVWEKIE